VKEKKRAGSGAPSSAARARILVVEDEAIIAMDLTAILRRRGWRVVGTAASGEESIIQAGAERPDVVLMDIRLQGPMNGLEAARVIKARWGIPVIFLTAYGEDALAGRLPPANGTPRLTKPFDEDDLERVLSKYLPIGNN
jgi:CheY-like chemotaxis protein